LLFGAKEIAKWETGFMWKVTPTFDVVIRYQNWPYIEVILFFPAYSVGLGRSVSQAQVC
jgi:hypothetical protein